jgi:AcrR family transcriptional regulator
VLECADVDRYRLYIGVVTPANGVGHVGPSSVWGAGVILYLSMHTRPIEPPEERIVTPSDPDPVLSLSKTSELSSQERRERLQRDARIARILTASQRLFSTQAYDEIAIEDLAAAAGMSKGLLYHYFESKRDLYVATVAHVLRQMAHFTDLTPDLYAGLSQMLSLFEQSPGLAKLVLRGGIGVDREVEGLLDAYRQQQLERLIRGLGSLGDFADTSTDAAGSQALVVLGLRGWLGLLDEVCLHWVQRPDVTREQVVQFLEQSLQAIVAATTVSRSLDDARGA